ncbi:MAG: hypothetical protein ACKOW8_04820, partial [Flavobacteriales bacterium]
VRQITDEEFIQPVSETTLKPEISPAEEIIAQEDVSADALAIQETPSLISAQSENIEEISSVMQEVVSAQKTSAPITDSLEIKMETQTHRPTRDELNMRNKEREMKIREFTMRVKTPGGLNELENEPAYFRKKVSLDGPTPSNESTVTRFSLQESFDENGRKKIELKDNPFLHDNVD